MAFKTPLIPYVKFPAQVPELPIRRHDDSGGPTFVTRAVVTQEHANGITLSGTTQTGAAVTIQLRIVARGVVRVVLEDAQSNPKRVTLAHPRSEPTEQVTLEKRDGHRRLVSPEITVDVDLEPFGITYRAADGRMLLAQNYTDRDVVDRMSALPFGYTEIDGTRVAFHDSFTVEPDEHFYGFGEKFTDFDKRGQQLTMWNHDPLGVHTEHTYKNVPFFISTRGYGLLVDSIHAIRFDMAATNHTISKIVVPDSALEYYVITAPDPKQIITRYAELTSLPILPPKWAFGLWMSSGFKEDKAEDVLARARELRAHDIPCDVLHLDCYWQRFGRWSEMIWDESMFPDPEGLLHQLDKNGFRICLWMNPYLGIESERFTEAVEKGYLLKTSEGKPWIGDMWSEGHPPVGIIDFTNPDAVAWFKDMLRPHLKIGADVFKTDFGEGVPPGVIAHNGMRGTELHNLYALLYNDAVAEVTAEVTGRSGMVWGRSTYTGGQRHAAQWGGDPDCTFPAMASTLRGGLSIGVCGHAFWSHDIGGFHTRPTPELFIRWAQFGLFSPLSRAHGMSTRLPWDYGEEAERIFRKYVDLRYRLMPYIYTCAEESSRTSLPIIRPLVLEFPDDPHTFTMDLQYLFGPDLMVAPIYNSEGRRPVYFPAGTWIDYWSHEVIEGPQTRTVNAPLDVLPLYVRANALIPTTAPQQHLTNAPFDKVTFEGYLLSTGACEMFDTDGVTQITAAYEDAHLNVTWVSPKPQIALRLLPLPGSPTITTVTANGVTLPETGPEAATGWTRTNDGSLLVRLG